MENKFRNLSKEMDRINEAIGRKKARIQEIKLFQQQKIDYLKKTEEKFMVSSIYYIYKNPSYSRC